MTGLDQRIEAAARALANEVAPESRLEYWGTQPEYLKDKFRRRAALALAAADTVEAPRAGANASAQAWQEGRESLAADMLRPLDEDGRRPAASNPYLEPVQETLDLGLEPAATAVTDQPARISSAAAAPNRGNCDGDCRGSLCSYCGCCIHTPDPSNCRTSAAPAGMRCPESGCGCEGTAA